MCTYMAFLPELFLHKHCRYKRYVKFFNIHLEGICNCSKCHRNIFAKTHYLKVIAMPRRFLTCSLKLYYQVQSLHKFSKKCVTEWHDVVLDIFCTCM